MVKLVTQNRKKIMKAVLIFVLLFFCHVLPDLKLAGKMSSMQCNYETVFSELTM